MNESKLISYADDTNIHFSHRNPHVVEQTVNRDLDNAAIWFRENGMRANPEKYQAIVLGNTSQDVTIKSGATEIPTNDEIEIMMMKYIMKYIMTMKDNILKLHYKRCRPSVETVENHY